MAWTISAKTDGEVEILLYDVIGGYDDEDWTRNSAKKFIDGVKALGDVKNLTLRINSVGGDVFEAQAMYSYLKTHRAHKTVRIDGLAASAASLVAMVGDKIIMPSNALLMIHNPASCVWGEASDMRETADILDKVRDTIAAVYIAKTGLDGEKIRSMMDEETWMSAEEALSLGFCDETDEAIEIAACAQSLTEGNVAWRTTAGETRFSRELAAKMPEASKKVPLTLLTKPAAGEPETLPSAPQPQNTMKPKEEKGLDIRNAADLEREYPQLVQEIRDAAVLGERKRLEVLDGLDAPGRKDIIAKAKYVEPKDARDIAMELLAADDNAQALADRQADAAAVNPVLPPTNGGPTAKEQEEGFELKIAEEINNMRGYRA